MQRKDEEGQAIILLALAMSIFLLGGVGLAIDGSTLYGQRQRAQAAADAAAQAGIMDIFDSTAGGFTPGTAFYCSGTPGATPCKYATQNGFNTGTDTVHVTFPASLSGVNLSSAFTTNLIQVDITRSVKTTLIRFLGPSATTINVTATAAIVDVTSPVPIVVTHPSYAQSLSLQGTPTITICGGPKRSIQVNSSSSTAASTGGNSSIDLSHAGPPDPGNCSTGTGSDFGVWGGPTTSPSVSYGTTGKYVQPASILQDPLRNVAAPPIPTNTGNMGTSQPLANGMSGCPASPKKACQLYYPGLWTAGIDGKNSTPVFMPGIYYIQSTKGMACAANCDMYMATGFTDSGANTTGTGWTGNALFYNTGPAGNASNAGAFNLGANGTINLVGSLTSSSYKGILFFQDHNSAAQSHSLGGGGAMTLVGTIYLTNTRSTMVTTPSQYQSLSLQGGSGSGTLVQGEIIVGTLQLGGNGSITMNLDSNASYIVSQVALVN